jgi:hypothetical protein
MSTLKFAQMFQDDYTKQLSGARVACFGLIVHYVVASIICAVFSMVHDGKFVYLDVPIGLGGLIALLYGINKTASTTSTTAEIKKGAKQ